MTVDVLLTVGSGKQVMLLRLLVSRAYRLIDLCALRGGTEPPRTLTRTKLSIGVRTRSKQGCKNTATPLTDGLRSDGNLAKVAHGLSP